jgi:hypothetical protein
MSASLTITFKFYYILIDGRNTALFFYLLDNNGCLYLCSVVWLCCRNCGIWYRFGSCNESTAHSTTEPSCAWLLEMVVDRICIVLRSFGCLHEVEVLTHHTGPHSFVHSSSTVYRVFIVMFNLCWKLLHALFGSNATHMSTILLYVILYLMLPKWGCCSKDPCSKLKIFDFEKV